MRIQFFQESFHMFTQTRFAVSLATILLAVTGATVVAAAPAQVTGHPESQRRQARRVGKPQRVDSLR